MPLSTSFRPPSARESRPIVWAAHVTNGPAGGVNSQPALRGQFSTGLDIERDETEIRIRAADETELERLIKKEVLRIRSEGKTATPGVVRPMPIERPRVNVQFQVDRYIWLRMAAKVALATTSLALDESWLDSEQARELQGWLSDSRPTNRSGEHLQGAPVRPEGAAMPLLCRPPEHLVLFHPLGPERAGLMAAVFGEVLLPIPAIELGGQPQPQRAWRLDPTTGRTVATTREALLAEAAVALVQAMNAAPGEERGGPAGRRIIIRLASLPGASACRGRSVRER